MPHLAVVFVIAVVIAPSPAFGMCVPNKSLMKRKTVLINASAQLTDIRPAIQLPTNLTMLCPAHLYLGPSIDDGWLNTGLHVLHSAQWWDLFCFIQDTELPKRTVKMKKKAGKERCYLITVFRWHTKSCLTIIKGSDNRRLNACDDHCDPRGYFHLHDFSQMEVTEKSEWINFLCGSKLNPQDMQLIKWNGDH